MRERRRKDADARREGLGEDDEQRRQNKQRADNEYRSNQRPSDGWRVADARRLPAESHAHARAFSM
jgi:hypothetical protein